MGKNSVTFNYSHVKDKQHVQNSEATTAVTPLHKNGDLQTHSRLPGYTQGGPAAGDHFCTTVKVDHFNTMISKPRGDHRRTYLRFGTAIGLMVLTGCITPHEIHVADLDPDGWRGGTEVIFENQDTTTERTLYVLARLRQDFGYDRLRLAVTTTTPEGYKWHDTLTIHAFDTPPESKLYFDREELLRTRMILAKPGQYLFTFTPVMPAPSNPEEAARQSEKGIEGVAAVGIEIR